MQVACMHVQVSKLIIMVPYGRSYDVAISGTILTQLKRLLRRWGVVWAITEYLDLHDIWNPPVQIFQKYLDPL